MRFLLDTCICIYYINGRMPQVRENVHKHTASDIAVCSITKCEMYAGSSGSQSPKRSRAKQDEFLAAFRSLPFDDRAANIYGQIFAELRKRGTPLPVCDLQIAAITLAHNLTLVTHNTGHFHRVQNLTIEDWAIASAS